MLDEGALVKVADESRMNLDSLFLNVLFVKLADGVLFYLKEGTVGFAIRPLSLSSHGAGPGECGRSNKTSAVAGI